MPLNISLCVVYTCQFIELSVFRQLQYEYEVNEYGYTTLLRHCATTARSPVRFLTGSLKFFIDLILPATLWLWGPIQPLTYMSTRETAIA